MSLAVHDRCQRIYGPRVTDWPCQRRDVVLDPAGWHCRQHSDAAKAARQKASADKYHAHTDALEIKAAKVQHFPALFDIVAEVAVAHPNARLKDKASKLIKAIKKDIGNAAI